MNVGAVACQLPEPWISPSAIKPVPWAKVIECCFLDLGQVTCPDHQTISTLTAAKYPFGSWLLLTHSR